LSCSGIRSRGDWGTVKGWKNKQGPLLFDKQKKGARKDPENVSKRGLARKLALRIGERGQIEFIQRKGKKKQGCKQEGSKKVLMEKT